MFKVNIIRQWRLSGVFTVNFEHISQIALVFPSSTLSRIYLGSNFFLSFKNPQKRNDIKWFILEQIDWWTWKQIGRMEQKQLWMVKKQYESLEINFHSWSVMIKLRGDNLSSQFMLLQKALGHSKVVLDGHWWYLELNNRLPPLISSAEYSFWHCIAFLRISANWPLLLLF